MGFSQIKIEDNIVALQSIVLKTSTLTRTNIKSQQKKNAKGVEIIKLEIILLHIKALYNENLDENMSSENLG